MKILPLLTMYILCNILIIMLKYSWNEDKNKLLKQTRGISFEQVVDAINNGHILDRLKHANPNKYKNQKILIIQINNYAYCIPYIQQKQHIFFKTIYASRKHTKKYLYHKEVI